MLPFLFFLIIISSVIFNLGANKKNANFKHNISLNNKIFLVFLTINVLGTIMWFFKFPLFRYGSSYLISTIATFLTILCWNKIQLIDLLKLKKILGYFTVFLLIILVSKNTIRIVKNYGQIYNDSPWPKIYSETKYNEKNKNKPIYKNNKIAFYQSTTGLCYYNTAPCTHMLDSQFAEKDINLKNIFGYKIFYFLK